MYMLHIFTLWQAASAFADTVAGVDSDAFSITSTPVYLNANS